MRPDIRGRPALLMFQVLWNGCWLDCRDVTPVTGPALARRDCVFRRCQIHRRWRHPREFASAGQQKKRCHQQPLPVTFGRNCRHGTVPAWFFHREFRLPTITAMTTTGRTTWKPIHHRSPAILGAGGWPADIAYRRPERKDSVPEPLPRYQGARSAA